MNQKALAERETVNKETGEIEKVERTELVPVEIFSSDPSETLLKMRKLVKMMDEMTHDAGREKFVAKIQGKDYPLVTWWTTIALPLQLMAVLRWTKRIDTTPDSGFKKETWQSRVEVVHTPTGQVFSAGEGICSADEGGMFAQRSSACSAMSHTRAIGRAFRGPLAGLAAFAGLAATPAEEMPGAERSQPAKKPAQDVGTDLTEMERLGKIVIPFGNDIKGKKFDEVNEDEFLKFAEWITESYDPEQGDAKWHDKNRRFKADVLRFAELLRGDDEGFDPTDEEIPI